MNIRDFITWLRNEQEKLNVNGANRFPSTQAAADTYQSRDSFRLIRQLKNIRFSTTKPIMNADVVITISDSDANSW